VLSNAMMRQEEVETRVNELLGRMTLEEKVGQTNQLNAFTEKEKDAVRRGAVGSILNAMSAFTGVGSSPSTSAELCNAIQQIAIKESRLGIPLLFGRDVIHGFRTVFPIPLAQAASWNPEMVEMAAAVAASEAAAHGIKWTFAPMLDIARDPRWGRVAEGFGEDPYLASALAQAAVRGFQGSDLKLSHKVIACAKHYVGYGAAMGGRDYDSAEISNRTLREVYLPPFHAAVKAGVGTIMAAFHDLNGVPLSAHRQLLTDILRNEWGFKGFVVSDWSSVSELVHHGIAANNYEAAALALFAGVDMDMVSGAYDENLAQLVQSGHLSMETLDEAVRRILRLKFLAGLFEKPYVDPNRAKTMVLTPENRNAAKLLAQQSLVLLKNDSNLLPIDRRFKRIAFVGPMVNSREELFGTWTPDGREEDVLPLPEAIKAAAPKDFELYFLDAADEAFHLARYADLIVAFVGEHPIRSGENANVADLRLPPGQRQFIAALAELGIPLVLVVFAGRPLAITQEARLADALLYAWHPGSEGGIAIAEVLFGAANPSGKLPITMPRATGQVPIFYNHRNSGRPAGSQHFPYRYVDLPHGPLYSFGYGLSYTQFRYENLEISAPRMSGPNEIRATVTNTGTRPGVEVAQLYIRDLVASVARPVKELKGFQRIALKPGESAQVSFQLNPADLTFIGLDDLPRIEPGEYAVWVGPNSAEGLQGSFTLEI